MLYQDIPTPASLAAQGKVAIAVPALVAILDLLAKDKGTALTRDEVEHARDNCACLVLPALAARVFQATRGYADLRLEHAWEDWLAALSNRG